MTFQFTKEQEQQVLTAAFHLSEASKYIMEVNGMMGLMFNTMALELMDQTGKLEHHNKVEIDLTQKEREEVDSLIQDIQNSRNIPN